MSLRLVNIKSKWVEGASITYIPQMDRYSLSIQKYIGIEEELFKTIKGAKLYFTRWFYKGVWEKESDEQN